MVKTALITGASSGIGRGIAHKFGQEGWEVTLVARRKENLENVAKEVEELGGSQNIFLVGSPMKMVLPVAISICSPTTNGTRLPMVPWYVRTFVRTRVRTGSYTCS